MKTLSPIKISKIQIHSIFLFLLFILPSTPQPARADGKELLKKCESYIVTKENENSSDISMDNWQEAISCEHYIKGIIEMNDLYQTSLGENALFCLPSEKRSHLEIIRILVDHLRREEELQKEDDSSAVLSIFSGEYPCIPLMRKNKK